MATYTSTQSGNFSASSTWGGGGSPSANGDIFNIAAGHTVTLDSMSTLSSGFDDSYIYGILKNSQSSNTELRMNGRLYIKGGGCLHLCDASGGVTTAIKFDGTNANQHGLWQENEADAHMVLEGSDGMPTTTLNGNHNENSTYFVLNSATHFAVGEWIAIFDHQTAGTGAGDGFSLRDEGFIIHDKNVNTVYFRHFVGPDDVTISAVSGATVTVNNAKKHRFGQRVIFGTGSNRNVKQISSIDLVKNQITFDSAVTGSVIGEIIYLTGSEKIHKSGDKVRKVATRITTESTGTTITVANSHKFAPGDEIFLAYPYQNSDGTSQIFYNAYELKHTIQSINTETHQITLTGAPAYTARVNAFVTRFTRNITIGGLTTSDRTYYYNEYLNDGAYSKTTIIKDVHFKDIGNSNNNIYSGFTFRGRGNSDASQVSGVSLTEQIRSHTQMPWLEGFTCTWVHNRDHSSIWPYSARYFQGRCLIAYNANDGLHPYWESGQTFYNCISARNDQRGVRHDGYREFGAFAYNYIHRNYYGMSHNPTEYEPNEGFHHNIIDTTDHYAISASGADNFKADGFYAWDIKGIRYGFYGKQFRMLYSRVQEQTSAEAVDDAGVGDHGGTSQDGHAYAQLTRGSIGDASVTILEYDFEIDRVAQYNYRCRRIWHEAEGAWAFRRRSQNNWTGFGHNVYVPAGVAVIARCAIRAPTGTSYTTYPRLYSSENLSAIDDNKIGNNTTGAARGAGQYYYVAYDSGMIGDTYQTKVLTIPAKDYSRTLNIGVCSYSANDQEGFFMKDTEIGFSKPYEVTPMAVGNSTADISFAPEFRTSFATIKKRLGGRIR